MMEPGKWIRTLRDERMIKPSDVERITRTVADAKGNGDFYVSHSTLADIEAGSIPSIYKLFSLAVCFRVPLNELLLAFGINPDQVIAYEDDARPGALTVQALPRDVPAFRFQLNFDTSLSTDETTLLNLQPKDLEHLPHFFRARIDPVRYRYAIIGSRDDSMADLLPPRCVVEIDTAQNVVQVARWRALRERPIYLVWHSGGHTCRWCQVEGKELTLVPHPLSSQPVRRYRTPSEATVVGRVINVWLSFESAQPQREVVS
jgi:hypothetical protein